MRHDYEVDTVLLAFWAVILLSALIWFGAWVAVWGIFE
jgi:hypothetical protein